MKKFFQVIFGKYPITSVLGYVVGVLTIVQDQLQDGETSAVNIIIAVITAMALRKAADSKAKAPKDGADDDGPGPGPRPTRP